MVGLPHLPLPPPPWQTWRLNSPTWLLQPLSHLTILSLTSPPFHPPHRLRFPATQYEPPPVYHNNPFMDHKRLKKCSALNSIMENNGPRKNAPGPTGHSRILWGHHWPCQNSMPRFKSTEKQIGRGGADDSPAGQIPFLGKAEERGTELECYWGNRCKIKVMAATEVHYNANTQIKLQIQIQICNPSLSVRGSSCKIKAIEK